MTPPVQIIRPPSFSILAMGNYLTRLMQFRDLLRAMTLHRISVRYKQSLL
jgi:hypothetical protein